MFCVLLKLLSSGFTLSLRFITLKQFKMLPGVVQVFFLNSYRRLSPKQLFMNDCFYLKDEAARVIEISRKLKNFKNF